MTDFARLVRAYINMRDTRAALKREWEAKDHDIQKQMERVENTMMSSMNDSKLESVRTEHGTAYISEVTKAGVGAWDTLVKWGLDRILKEQDHTVFELFERRVKVSTVNEYIEATGEVPPGVNLRRERNVRIRKS